jgi:ABC-type multidrug transport system permease subunit
MLFISAISTGILLASVSKKSATVQLIGLSIMLLTITLAGYFVPIFVIGGIEAIKYISLFSPINYATSLLNNVLIKPIEGISQSIFDFQDFSISSANPTEGSLVIIAA